MSPLIENPCLPELDEKMFALYTNFLSSVAEIGRHELLPEGQYRYDTSIYFTSNSALGTPIFGH